jgi:hypothetical protein
LPASDAATYANRTVDYINKAHAPTEEKDKSRYAAYQVSAPAALCERLDAAGASRTASAIIAVLGDGLAAGWVRSGVITYEFKISFLTEVAERLDAPGGLRAAEDLIGVLRGLAAALSAVCTHLYYLPVRTFQTIAARLDERDLQRLLDHLLAPRRVLQDVLAASKDRSFRNTWDYLDWTESNGNGTDRQSQGTNW